MDWSTALLFVAGLALLVLGADRLVRGASRLAAAAGVTPLVIGLTVVAFGTSAPELAVSVAGAWAGRSEMAVGNVVGSNLCNVLLILGASALITPLAVAPQLVRRDVPILIVLSGAFWALARDGAVDRLDGALLFGTLVLYTAWIVRASRRETRAAQAEYAATYGTAEARAAPVLLDLAWIVAGIALLALGAHWLVEGAIAFARWYGVREAVVSLTVVAVGTSLPELATSVVAAMRGERDIAVGNVVGSNVFNLLSVLGLSALVAPGALAVPDAMVARDIPLMVATAIACLPIFAPGFTIPRWEGALFLLCYAAYVVYLVLLETAHAAHERYAAAMLSFVLPLLVLTLGIVAIRVVRAHLRSRGA